MRSSLLLFVLLAASLSLCDSTNDRVVIASRDSETIHWRTDKIHLTLSHPQKVQALSSKLISFRIILKRQNADKLESLFWDLNSPSSPNWGKFLTRSQVEELVAPSVESKTVVKNWLKSFKVKIVEKSDYLEVFCTPAIVEEIFNTRMVPFVKVDSGKRIFRIWGEASVPSNVYEHIELVVGLSELFSGKTKFTPQHFQKHTQNVQTKNTRKKVQDDDILVTPAVLRKYYQIPEGQKGSSAQNLQAIAAFDDYFSAGALQKFAQEQGYSPNVTIHGPDCFLTDSCDQYESDLDIQYITAVGLNIPTQFYNHDQGNWILGWTQEINAIDKPGYVQSVSYGWSELSQCDITKKCSILGYDSKQYVEATNVEFQKLGTRGITVLVSDGDDGAASLGAATGNCPMDANFYCKAGGCQHTYTKCAEFSITLNNLKCNWPMGIGSAACQQVINQTGDSIIGKFFDANSQCNLGIEQDVQRNAFFFSDCTCDQLQAVTFNGATITGFTFSPQNGPLFTADYPTSSPYVTSVGATQFVSSGNQISKEIACSVKTGAIITTGGGFSSFQPQISAQKQAVSDFFSNPQHTLPPDFSYDKTKRAYPDVSFVGHKYNVYASQNQQDPSSCPCSSLPVDGTSASSPALAGLLSLVNDALLGKGLSPLGYVNTLLYSIYSSDAYNSIFIDITEGDNFCTRVYCCQYGWTAQKGWDPVTGLGSPKFQPLLNYVLKAKLEHKKQTISLN